MEQRQEHPERQPQPPREQQEKKPAQPRQQPEVRKPAHWRSCLAALLVALLAGSAGPAASRLNEAVSGIQYEGERNWLGQPHGRGTMRHDGTSDHYVGDFVRGEKDGRGKYIWADGTNYEGEYKADMREGRGSLHLAKSKGVYEGEFAKDKEDGRGTFTLSDGAAQVGIRRAGKPDLVLHWSPDRKTVHHILDEKTQPEISLEQARKMLEGVGMVPPTATVAEPISHWDEEVAESSDGSDDAPPEVLSIE